MSECVVRMEMPKACSWIENGEKKKCPISEWGGACAITKQFKMPDGCRPSWCPIICKLPEGHGRLVDMRDIEQMEVSASDKQDEYFVGWNDAIKICQTATTIVPAAERSES